MPRPPSLNEFWRVLDRTERRLSAVLEIPRIPRRVRAHLAAIQADLVAILVRNGRRISPEGD
jgi:hypothetical protein